MNPRNPAVVLVILLAATAAAFAAESDLLGEADSALLQNRLALAEASYRAFLEPADAGAAADRELLHALSGLGTALVLQSRGGEARAHLERALRLQQTLAPEDDLVAAGLLHALARSAVLEQRLVSARAWLKQELRLLETHADDRPEELARALRELARLSGSPRSSAIDRELALYERALGDGRIGVPPLLQEVAREAPSRGSIFRLHFLRAAALVSEPLWRDDRALADALAGLGAQYAAAGDTRESLRWFERAWGIRAPEKLEQGLEAYRALSGAKAFAAALDAHGRWTFGFCTGEKTPEDAAERALAECRRRLPWYGVEADCSLYASNERIVWKPVSVELR
jgi:hypothetical protein